MAGYMSIEYYGGAGAHAVIERDADGFYWKPGTSAWEAFSGGSWANYAINLPQLGSSYIFRAAFPAAIAAGVYTVRYRDGAAGTPAQTSIPLANELWDWSGTARRSVGDVWSNTPRTLTQSPAVSLAAAVLGTDLTLQRGDTLSLSLTDLGSLTGNTKLWFTVKRRRTDTDAAAVLQIERTAGLLHLDGNSVTAGDATLAVDDAATGAITLTLAATAAALLPVSSGQGFLWDVQMKTAAGITTLAEGHLRIVADITAAVS